MDTVSKQKRSQIMRQIRSKNTGFEVAIFLALKKKGIALGRGEAVYGKPDIILRKRKTAIFLDSCFWHGCRWHCRMPRTKVLYWQKKIGGNKARARKVNRFLRNDGWRVIRVWEHKFKRDFDGQINLLHGSV